MVRVTEAAAIAASKLIGRGDEKAADAAAVEAMREAFNTLYIDGTVVIGEGERDEAPMLYIGEKVGGAIGTGPKIDIALDPLEGTTITAKAGPNALAVLAVAEEGLPAQRARRLHGQARGRPRLSRGDHRSRQDRRPRTSRRSPRPRASTPDEIIVCVLDRPRHAALIAELRGARLRHRADRRRRRRRGDRGDRSPTPRSTSTWARAARPRACSPRRRCAASAASSRAGCCSATTTRGPAPASGASTDLDRIYKLEDLAKGDCIFAATGVTDGSLLDGVKRRGRAR